MTDSTKQVITVGVDLGTETIKTTLGSTLDYELVRNLHGGHTTPCSITFKHKSRLIGEDATEAKNADVNTILHVARLVLLGEGGDLVDDGLDSFYRFERRNDEENGERVVTVEYNGEQRIFSVSALLAMLLGKIGKCVDATIARKIGAADGEESSNVLQTKYVFAVPSSEKELVKGAVLDAVFASGLTDEQMKDVQVVSTAQCTAAVYERKFAKDFAAKDSADAADAKEGKVVLVVDMGHSQSIVSILRLGSTKNDHSNVKQQQQEETPTEENKQKTKDSNVTVTVLSSAQSNVLGAGNIDIQLWKYFIANTPKLSSMNIKPNSRKGQKLLEGCRKLKHLLSMLPSGSVIVESLTENDEDVTLAATREILQGVCKEESEALTALIQKAVQDVVVGEGDDVVNVDAVEILGGGCRVPFVQQTILKSIGKTSEEMTLSRSLDDTSIALGAAMIGDANIGSDGDGDGDGDDDAGESANKERRNKLRQAEVEMSTLDEEMSKLSEARNKIESHILELRSAKHDTKYGSLLPDASVLDAHLDGVDDWLFSEECDGATLQEMEAKLESIVNKSKEMCAEYYSAIQKDTEEVERQMVEEEERAKAEQQANGGDGEDEEDHDNRRLPKKRRMEIVMKNKNEANELFSDKNYRFAAARYVKALSHCSKFYDLTPEDEAEVKSVKLSLHLNLALAYYKLEKYDNALRSCNDALEIDGDSTKALFRRATVYYEKKKWEDAKKDLDKASQMAPDDKAVQKLQARLEQQIKRQKAKEKKMAKKMFG